jgi:N-acetylmuramic acid 6-phosphate etherase
MSASRALSDEFLKVSAQFRLGELPTESRHPLTKNLSTLAVDDLDSALRLLRQVEIGATQSAFANAYDQLKSLSRIIVETWASGGRVFFCGCGATGRLSVSLEALWRKECAARGADGESERVLSFIAGGDYALVRSIENFEDHPEYGAQQLRDLGFSREDLLIATTEGGETPFVIGATLEAASISSRAPWFLFCNPRESLMGLERCRDVFSNPGIQSVSLPTGPMALAGSTRLQASTVLMLAGGACLFSAVDGGDPQTHIDEFLSTLSAVDFSVLAPLISREAEGYAKGSRCLHSADEHAITVLTDTTERSPTFSIAPFENELSTTDRLAWTYLTVPSVTRPDRAWEKILMRPPRPLTWKSVAKKYDASVMGGFDFSTQTVLRRRLLLGAPLIFSVESGAGYLHLSIGGRAASLPVRGSRLTEHLILKCAMNMSSMLVMGRLGRFQSNLMLYVKASNNKLIDRAIRYIRLLQEDAGSASTSYDEVCHALFEVRLTLDPEDSIVLRTLEKLDSQATLKSRSQGRIA